MGQGHGVMNYHDCADHPRLRGVRPHGRRGLRLELHQLLAEHADTTPAHLTLLGSHDTPRIHT
ncbi:MAG: hypothetical protein U0452_09785 [Anaerolineae bacterium]